MEKLRLRKVSDFLIFSGLIMVARPIARALVNPSQEPPPVVQSLQENYICSPGILGVCTFTASDVTTSEESVKLSDYPYPDLLSLGGGLTAISMGLSLRSKKTQE